MSIIVALKTLFNRCQNKEFRYSTWENLLKDQYIYWNSLKKITSSSPNILIATSLGGYNHGVLLESLLAVALTLRGAKVDMLLCDELLPACQLTKYPKISPEELTRNGQKRFCKDCFKNGNNLYRSLGINIYYYSQFVESIQKERAKNIASTFQTEQIKNYKLDGLAVGEHAYAGTLRYFARGDLEGEHLGSSVAKLYLESSLLAAFAINNLLNKCTYDAVCFHHGIYVPQGLIGEVCRKRGIRVVNWNPSYRKNTFIFSHGNSYHHTMISEKTNTWKNIKFTKDLERKTMDYLKSRWYGTEDWIWFHEKPVFELRQVEKKIGINFDKPTVGMLTNVMWDAQLHYKSNAFPNMLVWVIKTIEYFSKRKDLQLAIRVHPAEVTGMISSRQPIISEIKKYFKKIPNNVYIIPPDSNISTYAVIEKCNSIIIYNTKTGIEIASTGIPVIVAGEAWIRNKGFSKDAKSEKEYFDILDTLPFKKRMNLVMLRRARKYAFHFFFRRMIPLPFFSSREKFQFSLNLSDIKDLLPGNYLGLDVVCDGILYNKPFIYPAEKYDQKP
jgi:hypothetical protein